MDAQELIDFYREESKDKASPPFVEDDLLLKFANEAQIEAVRRGRLITDSTSSFCTLSVTAGEPLIELDALVLDVVRLKRADSGYQLYPEFTAILDESCPDWENQTGQPTHYAVDYQTGCIRLYPSPVKEEDLRMTVKRLPLKDIDSTRSTPEIRKEWHQSLVHWMLYRAYSMQDSDMYDPRRSAIELSEFEKEFGKKTGGRNEEWQRGRNTINTQPIA
jgi:hypothetical protein